MKICGQCVGTDKIGHMFQQGKQLIDLENKYSAEIAIAILRLTEGLDPGDARQAEIYRKIISGEIDVGELVPGVYEDRFPQFDGTILDPNGQSSESDTKANLAGRDMWRDILAGKFSSRDFDICKYLAGYNVDQSIKNTKPNRIWRIMR